ncbi:MAG TPA: phenylalanine--tRNA ligase subunit beta, partial [Thermoanaerobaculia bacterium]|nr:phenylalanine--tRNA ligase subunit beta [Thermoanaerobaculia bacterium]
LTGAGLAVERTEERGGDVLFDVEVTTNRPDAMCHFGIARELSVLLDQPLRWPEPAFPEAGSGTAEAVTVTIADPDLCSRYAARVVRGVRIGESPEWLRRALLSIGLRSINNVVDVTNFVLWESGQPLHALDLAKIAGGALAVRRAASGERLTTLDGVERALDPDVLVIADAERPVALGGVMGGLASEVTDSTVDLLLESACFDRRAVRLASRKLGMHTDASHRFERGTDLEFCRAAADRAAALILEVAGGEPAAGAVDVRAGSRRPRRGRLEHAKLCAFVGAEIPSAAVGRWLAGLGFAPESSEPGAWDVSVPSWRYFDFDPRRTPPDAASEEIYPADLYEEMLRLYGFDPVVPTLPALGGADAPKNPIVERRARIQGHLAAAGFAETIQYAFIDERDDAAFPHVGRTARPERTVPLVNPLSERYGVLRRSLLPGLVESARFNKRRGAAAVRIFEVGRVFFAADDERSLPDQPERVALLCGGRVGTPWERPAELDFFDLKGAVESLAESWGVELTFRAATLPAFEPGVSAEILAAAGGEASVVGLIGRLAGEEGYPLFAAELAADALLPEPAEFLARGGALEPGAPGVLDASGLEVEAPSRFPGVAADLTLTHSLDVLWRDLDRSIRELAPADLVAHGLVDRYRGKGVPDGAVNTTIHFLYNADDRSLTQDEVNERQAGLTRALESRFGWKG